MATWFFASQQGLGPLGRLVSRPRLWVAIEVGCLGVSRLAREPSSAQRAGDREAMRVAARTTTRSVRTTRF